jgi:hypothetical protein
MLWQKIGAELRELPDTETCRQVFANGTQTRKVAGDLTVSIVHPKAGHSAKYSVRDLDGIMVGMTVEIQPLLVTAEPGETRFPCIVSYESGGVERSFEVRPVALDEAGFDVNAPVFEKEYARPPDTAREKARKSLPSAAAMQERNAALRAAGAAHSFINPKNPFLHMSEGEAISVAETVKVSEILISVTEAAKRYKAETGDIPEGFIAGLKKQFPNGVSTTAVNALIAEWKERNKSARDYKAEAAVYGGEISGISGIENFAYRDAAIAAEAQRKFA